MAFSFFSWPVLLRCKENEYSVTGNAYHLVNKITIMQFTANDVLGFTGVAILLAAYLLNLLGKIQKEGYAYIVMNALGGGLACLASYLIHYLPFVILEGTWMLVSLMALFRLLFAGNTIKP